MLSKAAVQSWVMSATISSDWCFSQVGAMKTPGLDPLAYTPES